MQARREERSLGELFTDLTHEISNLFRQEVALAKSEVTQKAKSAGKDVGFIAGGGAVAFVGFMALVAAAIAAAVGAHRRRDRRRRRLCLRPAWHVRSQDDEPRARTND